ncbi:TetR/AcrR family transcriptional regulator [Catellatospora sp. KI3]|uniref:TetR/AcrR family transcriptional regulator n=1 Tax=Catellatospora sp. KI3 TaxID=3041620 RepID=UPI0024825AF1|nr:TetR/AcrR family transcriptional regulator [Catellatospora sp. KI3]MDI1459528.1 TetR/AcrR family transcriptional regulator [Catellatospora sp. KI3]
MESNPLRADAARNRERIVTAACELFAERGLDVPLEEVAGRAGVGIATLYRRFPTRDELTAAAASTKIEQYEQALREARTAPDAWTGFSAYVTAVCAMQAADGGLADVLTMSFPGAREFEQRRIALHRGFTELVAAAKAEGTLREDYVAEDLPLLLMANAGVLRGTAGAAPKAWQRLVAYLLQAFRAGDRVDPLPAPPTPRQTYRAMLRISGCQGRSQPPR